MLQPKRRRATPTIITPEVPDEPSKVIDLMAALEASVAEAKAARKRHPTGDADEDEDEAASKKRSAKKSTAKKSAAKRTSTRKSA